jgi:hypothetical protein
VALYPTRTTDGERIRGELQRVLARRVPQRKLVRRSGRGARNHRSLAPGLEPMPTALDARLSYPEEFAKSAAGDCGKDGGKAALENASRFPTFPQPRRLRTSTYECYARNPNPGESLIIPGLKTGGRSTSDTTLCLEGRCSIHLSYGLVVVLILAVCYPSEQRLDPNCDSKLRSSILGKQWKISPGKLGRQG